MGMLDGKTALVFGVANDHSIAWGISQAFHREGARVAFSYAGEALERRVRPLAARLDSTFVEPCDVGDDDAIRELFAKAKAELGTIDILVHGIAFANREDLAGRFIDTSRDGFKMAHDISVYSLVALTREAAPLMPQGGAVLTLSYYGAEKVVERYNVMGVAKAALEASVRYLAADVGPQGIRVNAISAGPIRTLAAAGISGFKTMHRKFRDINPMRTEITIDDIGDLAAFIASDRAKAITGETLYVDGGYNIMGLSFSQLEAEG